MGNYQRLLADPEIASRLMEPSALAGQRDAAAAIVSSPQGGATSSDASSKETA